MIIQLEYSWEQLVENDDYKTLRQYLKQIPYQHYTMAFVTLPTGSAAIEVKPNKTLSRMKTNYKPFKQHIDKCTGESTAFLNKDKDVILVIPCHIEKNFKDIATFTKLSTQEQFSDLFRLTFKVAKQTLNEGFNQVYITTHGLGVSWLHMRINYYPKYFQPHPQTLPTLMN